MGPPIRRVCVTFRARKVTPTPKCHLTPDRADFIGIVSNFRSRAAMRRLAAAFRANSNFPLETTAMFPFVPGISWSDHRSFWRKGYRAVMITDTASYRYRHYHLPTDTPDKLAYPELTRVTSGVCGFL